MAKLQFSPSVEDVGTAVRPSGAAKGLDLEAVAEMVSAVEAQAANDGDISAGLAALAAFAGEPAALTAPGKISPQLAWMPFSYNEALSNLALTRIVNERVAAGYYRDRIVVLVTQEKSASTLHDVALLHMLQHSAGVAVVVPVPRSLKGGPLAMAGHAAFHFGLLHFLPSGGVMRGEFVADPQNLWMIKRILGFRTVLLTRHPADRLVALFCMRQEGLRSRMKRFGKTDLSDEAVLDNLFAGNSLTMAANIGTLRHNLHWLESWVQEEAQERSVIARYEDMLADSSAHFARIHQELFGTPMSAPLKEAVEAALSRSGEGGALQSGDSGTRSYPKGYSGKVGVWKDYLTAKNVATYNDVVQKFLGYTSYASEILAIYPDLLLDPAEIAA
jgi:hypothetical protein